MNGLYVDSIAKIKTEDGNVNELIRALEKCEMEIRNEGIFSNNEDFEDVNEDQLEYFEYDYYLAKVYGRQRTSDIGDRLLLIEKVSLFYDAFLNRCELYGFVSKDSMEEHLSMMEGNRTRDAIRAYKINRYQLEKEMKTIQKNNKLDYRIGIQLSAMDAMDEQYALQQERALLEKVHVEHIKENIEFKHKPTPSTSGLEVTHIDATMEMRKEIIRGQVFQSSHRPPTMSLEDYADQQVLEAKEREIQQSNAPKPDRKIAQLEQDGDEDDEELADKATYLDRNWDNWKDANPKGIGNKKGSQF